MKTVNNCKELANTFAIRFLYFYIIDVQKIIMIFFLNIQYVIIYTIGNIDD
jgi:hypothetical protein